LRTFIEAGRTQGNVSTIDWNTAAGFSWTGLIAARPNDILGVSANYAHISPQAETLHPYELSLEWIYQTPLWKWAILTPDLQFIIHPSGKYSNALVGTLNFNVQF
jgi:porin